MPAPILILLVAAAGFTTWRALRRRRFIITGIVRVGFGLSDKTGVKTANLDVALAKNLRPGLYAASIELNCSIYRGLLYHGHNMLSGADCLEVHILDFNGDIYGKKITVTTTSYLRPPKKFASLEKLNEQIKKDLAMVKII